MAKGNKRLLKLRRDLKIVKYILTERMGVDMISLFKRKIGRGELLCQCGEPRERGHFLKCKKWDYKDLIKKVLKYNKNNLGLYLIGEGAKEFRFWLKETGYYIEWQKNN